MNNPVISPLRIVLVLVFLGSLFGQTILVPAVTAEATAEFPEVAHLAMPYTFVVILGIVCFQVALFAIWILLQKVQRESIFTHGSFRWVNVIIWAAAACTVMVLLLGMHLLGIVQVGGPGVVFAVGGTVICGIAFVLLMVVMRDLLWGATTLESELAEVV